MPSPAVIPIEWSGSASQGVLRLLDQRLLPEREEWIAASTVDAAAAAIRSMAVRGAPAIGLTGAYAMVLAAQEVASLPDAEALRRLGAARTLLGATRPTAVNLFWALAESWRQIESDRSAEALLALAKRLHAEDIEGNRKIAATGAARIETGMGILTHCNAGALATGGVGTALGVIGAAHAQGKRIHVYVDETRPRLQGARLTAWELGRLGVPHTLICDNMSGSLMAQGRIQLCVTGADRIAANGDTANKIGTYGVAVLAHHHGVGFHVAAPASTFDLSLSNGKLIPIEERDGEEVTSWGEARICPATTQVFNPAFDVTPATLIRSIFTELGEVQPVSAETIRRVVSRNSRAQS
jgi:methylthioribose-1-phosphate isomerase